MFIFYSVLDHKNT